MPTPHLASLYAQYPVIIAQMPAVFTSHEFILRLAQQHQADYIEALHVYRADEPFRKLHGLLARRLRQHRALVIQIADAPSSLNIFNEPQICARWQRR